MELWNLRAWLVFPSVSYPFSGSWCPNRYSSGQGGWLPKCAESPPSQAHICPYIPTAMHSPPGHSMRLHPHTLT